MNALFWLTTAFQLYPRSFVSNSKTVCSWLSSGTPLGDPIELGAATAVFLDSKTASEHSEQTSSIALLAAKSWVGHAEPAAGIVGLAHAHLALHHHMLLPVLHLGHINPHVASALRHGSASGQFQIMRGQAGMTAMGKKSDLSLRCGVSAFAFQGTNAHAIIEQILPFGASQLEGRPQLDWQKSVHWIAPPAHALLTAALLQAETDSVTMVTDLTSTRASHMIQGMLVHGSAFMSLDLTVELMTEALQQVMPDAPHVQLQRLVSVAVAVQSHEGVTQPQQLTVRLTGAALIVQHLASQTFCCQALAVRSSVRSCIGADTGSSTFLRALQSPPAATQAAATAVLSSTWSGDQGFCLPGPVITSASQLQTAVTLAGLSTAVVPNAAACLSIPRSDTPELALLACSPGRSPGQLDATVASDVSSASACQLSGIEMIPALKVLSGASQNVSQDAGMLYATVWKAVAPELHTVTQSPGCRQGSHKQAADPVPACAALMAAAQQAIQTGTGHLNSQLTPGLFAGPCQAMALALLRSAAQEASAAVAQMSPVSKSESGLVREPRLVPCGGQHSWSDSSPPAASYMVLGGTGSIGSLAALWSADRGAEEVVMVGRTGKLSQASASNFSTLLANQARNNGSAMITIAR